jgi:hypothetical protein
MGGLQHVGEQHGVIAAGVGEPLAVGSGDAGEQLVGAGRSRSARGLAEQPGQQLAQLTVAEPGRDE